MKVAQYHATSQKVIFIIQQQTSILCSSLSLSISTNNQLRLTSEQMNVQMSQYRDSTVMMMSISKIRTKENNLIWQRYSSNRDAATLYKVIMDMNFCCNKLTNIHSTMTAKTQHKLLINENFYQFIWHQVRHEYNESQARTS